jgi:hypothetical protein
MRIVRAAACGFLATGTIALAANADRLQPGLWETTTIINEVQIGGMQGQADR